jgi:hypothetical protein
MEDKHAVMIPANIVTQVKGLVQQAIFHPVALRNIAHARRKAHDCEDGRKKPQLCGKGP